MDVNACGLPRRSGPKHPQNADLRDRPAISRYGCGVEAAYWWAVAKVQRHDSNGQASFVLRLGRRGLLLRPHIWDEMHQLMTSFELYHERAVAGDVLPTGARPSRFKAVLTDWPVTPITRARPLEQGSIIDCLLSVRRFMSQSRSPGASCGTSRAMHVPLTLPHHAQHAARSCSIRVRCWQWMLLRCFVEVSNAADSRHGSQSVSLRMQRRRLRSPQGPQKNAAQPSHTAAVTCCRTTASARMDAAGTGRDA